MLYLIGSMFLMKMVGTFPEYRVEQRSQRHLVQFWIAILLAAYGGALLVGSLVSGWAGDRLPQRHAIFFFGLVMLMAATALLQFGGHAAILVMGRFFQGLAAAVVWTSGLALLTDVFGKDRYGEAIGYAQTATSFGTTCAPLLGGVVYGRAGYWAVSAMSIGTVALSVVLAIFMVEPKSRRTWEEQARDYLKAEYRRFEGGKEGGNDGSFFQRRPGRDSLSYFPDETSTLLPNKPAGTSSSGPAYLVLLRSGRVLAAMGGIFTFAFVIINLEGMIPLFVKDTFHWTSTQAALIFLSWIIPGFLGPLAGKASDRFGPRWVAIGGFLFAVAPLICLRLITRNTTEQKVLLCALLAMIGFGMLTREVDDDTDDAGASTQAFGLFVFAFSCGSFVGPAVAGIIKAKTDWGTATLILACVCALTCVPIFFKTSASSRRAQNNGS
ncbi:uncharacterized protein KY384_008773 [Bacidia gigantensis]|uniref:uncharacterized protein n=1 Tax=Bacidia gigantensis TaxID=2732470 RepID=UPI001D043F97|nr:uncharacterized protein KY384_008773 [Bacidia gigantensis]KAG8526572.1 hypothetical protein KY384_008773 [Bacidia gigantensis]